VRREINANKTKASKEFDLHLCSGQTVDRCLRELKIYLIQGCMHAQ
jgi:hypothetical protein